MLTEEIPIKDAPLAHITARHRPHYPPTERMTNLELKAARHLSATQTAARFLLKPDTISEWMRRLDDYGEDALLQK